MSFVQYFLIIFIISFQVSHGKEVCSVNISGIEVPDKVLREVVEYTSHPLKTIENFKLVSKDFYHFVYREFGIRNCSTFKEDLKLKKMFLVFLDQEDQDRNNKIKKFKFNI